MVWAQIDLDHLRHNLRVIRRALKDPRTEVLAIVKADAYGHGMREVAKTLQRSGVTFFGVANIDEALILRKTCPSARILVVGTFHESQTSLYVRHRIRPTLSSEEDVRALSRALPGNARFPVHVKVDTGMGRLGVWHADAEILFRKLLGTDKLAVEGVYTHFASAEETGGGSVREQIYCFKLLKRKVLELGLEPKYWHTANSLGLLRFKDAHMNLVRPGLLLYGLNPGHPGRLSEEFKPVMSLKTRVSFLKKVPAGRTLSYGGTYQTPKDTWIATLPIGYSHGYRVGFSNKGIVLVNGTRCPVVGRVTMDQTLVDVGDVASVKRWDEVTLIGEGQDKRARIKVEELAKLVDTIPYEIVCSIHSRIPRVYKGLSK